MYSRHKYERTGTTPTCSPASTPLSQADRAEDRARIAKVVEQLLEQGGDPDHEAADQQKQQQQEPPGSSSEGVLVVVEGDTEEGKQRPGRRS